MAYSPYGRYFWQQKADVTVSGNSGQFLSNANINTTDATDFWLAAFVAGGTPTGTTPTLNVQLDVFDAFGNLFPAVASLTQLTAATTRAHASVGVHVQGGTSLVIPAAVQVSWTIAGAGAKFPGVCFTLLGR